MHVCVFQVLACIPPMCLYWAPALQWAVPTVHKSPCWLLSFLLGLYKHQLLPCLTRGLFWWSKSADTHTHAAWHTWWKKKVCVLSSESIIYLFTTFILCFMSCLWDTNRGRHREGGAEPMTFCSCVYRAEYSSALDLSPGEGGVRGR